MRKLEIREPRLVSANFGGPHLTIGSVFLAVQTMASSQLEQRESSTQRKLVSERRERAEAAASREQRMQDRKAKILKAAFFLSLALAMASVSFLLMFGNPSNKTVSHFLQH